MTTTATQAPTQRMVLRLIAYYAVLIAVGTVVMKGLPRAGVPAPASLDAIFGGGPPGVVKGQQTQALDEATLAITVAVAMMAAVLLALPVAWTYLLTRAKRGYQQSVVQLLVILPLVVSGVVLLVKYSVNLAFGLAGVVAAVRFRNSLDDSKDAVYVFLATGIGLAAAVNLPVALVLSCGFNVVVLVLWYTDFGNAPVELDGQIAARRLKRARQLARTGTFVARMDDEVLQNMTRDQLQGLAERAWRRATEADGDTPDTATEYRIVVRARDAATARQLIEPKLEDYTRHWRMGATFTRDDEEVIEYHVSLKKKHPPEELMSLIRAAASKVIIDCQISS